MMDDKIGTIGNTHGVSESSTPISQNAPTAASSEPCRNTDSTALLSPLLLLLRAASVGVGDGAALSKLDVAAGLVELSAPAAATTEPSPPQPRSDTRSVWVCGG